MSKIVSLILLLAVALAVTSNTFAAKGDKKGPPDPAKLFAKLDTNNDGVLTEEEFVKGPAGQKDAEKAKAQFAKIPRNKDGKVTVEEFKTFMAQHAGGHKKK